METTNQIEKALEKKINVEIMEIVEQFTNKCEALDSKYGSYTFQELRKGEQSITCMRDNEFKNVLFDSLKDKYGPYMLKTKSTELIEKLDLI